MSEESILILNMLREGKVTAEQADSLLRAVRENTPPVAPIPPVPPVPPTPPPPPIPPISGPNPEALAAMQQKLSEMQQKLGEMQGKLGAAQAARAAGQAASFAGKVMDALPNVNIDIQKMVDEALRGINSLKNDAVQTARDTARQAAREARRAARQAGQEGRKAFKWEFRWDDNDRSGRYSGSSSRPVNEDGLPQVEDTTESVFSWAEAERLVLANAYGDIQITGREDLHGSAQATITRLAWADSEADARVLLQQVFLTHRMENGQFRVEVIAPQDSKNRLVVDYVIFVPQNIPVEVETTFGKIAASEISAAFTAASLSGSIRAGHPQGTGDAKLSSKSGDIDIEQWIVTQGGMEAETTSGEVQVSGLNCSQSVTFSTHSGDVKAKDIQVTGDLKVKAISGDVSVHSGQVTEKATLKSQSGSLNATDLRAESLHLETISGDANARSVAGTLTLKAVSGSVAAEELSGQSVTMNTVSGDGKVTFAAPFSGMLTGTTVSGDLKIALWSNSEARLEMNTLSGSLECALPLADGSTGNSRHLSGTIGDGTGTIRLQSVSGDLQVTGIA